jgi:hypothetical protein
MEGIVVASKDINPKVELMELRQARNILQAVVSTHQDSITLEESDNVVGFNIQQIRQAALAVGLDLVNKNKSIKTNGLTTIVRKNIGENSKSKVEGSRLENGNNFFLTLKTEWAGWDEAKSHAISGEYSEIELVYRYLDSVDSHGFSPKPPVREVQSSFPLISDARLPYSIFKDDSVSKKEESFHCEDGKYPELFPLTTEKYRLLFKGMRWMFVNMLNWNSSEVIFPEQLDHLPLSKH